MPVKSYSGIAISVVQIIMSVWQWRSGMRVSPVYRRSRISPALLSYGDNRCWKKTLVWCSAKYCFQARMEVKVLSLNCWAIPYDIPGFSSPHIRQLENSSQIHSPWLGNIVDSGIEMSYRPIYPVSKTTSLARRYDNPMPESTLSPQ